MFTRTTFNPARILHVPDDGNGNMLGGLGDNGLGAAADAFKTELDGEYGVQQPERKRKNGVIEAEEDSDPDDYDDDDDDVDVDSSEFEPGDDDADDDSEDQDDSEDDADDQDDDGGDDDSSDPNDPQKLKVTIDGESQEISLEEAAKGYQRQAHYTKSMQELSERRQQITQQENEVQQVRDAYLQNLEKLDTAIRSYDKPQAYWDNLYKQDPDRYAEELRSEQQRQANIKAIEQERGRVEGEQTEKQRREAEQELANQRDKMSALIPDWVDQGRREKDVAQISKYGQGIGFAADELSAITDARAVRVLRDAAKWQALQDKREGRSKDQSEAKPSKGQQQGKRKSSTMTPGRPRNQKANNSRRKSAAQNLQKSGSLSAAEAYFQESGAAD